MLYVASTVRFTVLAVVRYHTRSLPAPDAIQE